MLTTRILLLGMPLMLRQLLVQIVAQVPSIDFVAELADDNLLSAKVLETPADFVVIDSDRRRGGRLTGGQVDSRPPNTQGGSAYLGRRSGGQTQRPRLQAAGVQGGDVADMEGPGAVGG